MDKMDTFGKILELGECGQCTHSYHVDNGRVLGYTIVIHHDASAAVALVHVLQY
jgi:hypothetical protein